MFTMGNVKDFVYILNVVWKILLIDLRECIKRWKLFINALKKDRQMSIKKILLACKQKTGHEPCL